MIRKILTVFSVTIIVYFVFGIIVYGLAITDGYNSAGRAFIEPLKLSVEIAKRIKKGKHKSGLFNDKLNLANTKGFNSLKNDLYYLHTTSEWPPRIKMMNLKDSSIHFDFELPENLRGESFNSRQLCALSEDGKMIACMVLDTDRFSIISAENGETFLDTTYSFELHHRIQFFDGLIHVNTRRDTSYEGGKEILDEGFAVLNTNGDIIEEFWLGDQYGTEEFQKLLNMINYTSEDFDPFHVNDIEKVICDCDSADILQEGDYLLSLRHMSAIVHVRSNKIVDAYTGDFNLQHDVDVLSCNEVSVFNNNSLNEYLNLGKTNSNIVKINLQNDSCEVVFDDEKIATKTEGQVEVLPSGRMVVENQNNGQILVYRKGQLVYQGNILHKEDNSLQEILNWGSSFDTLKQ